MTIRAVQSTTLVDVAVLGAGPAGLAAAWYSARRGHSVTVLDRATAIGGLAASTVVDGQRVDLGSHRLHPSIRPDLLADLAGLLGPQLQRRRRNGRIRFGGRWVAFPLRPADLVRSARPTFAARVMADVVSAPVRSRRRGGDDFRSQVRRGMGPAISTAFYEPYATKLWGLPADQLSGELYRRRVSARNAVTVLRTALRGGEPPSFWYPAGGFGRIVESIAEALAMVGGTIELGVEPCRVTPCPGGGATIERRGGPPTRARTIISTVGADDLTRIAAAPPTVRAAASSLEHRGCVIVYLSVPGRRFTSFDAHYFPEPSVRIARLSEPKAYRDSPDDPREHTVLCAEIPATVSDDIWTAPDDELAALVQSDLAAVGLPAPQPRTVHVERRARVYPIYRRGFEQARDRVDAWLDRLDGVVALGRQALFAHDNTHHALLMGRAVADCLDAVGNLDKARWRVAKSEFAEHVVED